MNFTDTEDLTVGKGAYYDRAALMPGVTLPLNFSVTNNGTKAVSEIHVDILDSSDAVLQSGTVSCVVGVGETADVSYNYTLPAVLENQAVTIKAYTENETKLTDNTVSLKIGLADVAVGNMYLSGNSGSAALKGEIANLGCKDASDVTVTVYDANEEGDVIGTIEKIPLSQKETTLGKGQTLLLDAVITPNEAEDKQLKWSSSDINVASMENGLVTAIGAGTATIMAESMDGSNVKASCRVTVTDKAEKRVQEFAGTKSYSKAYGDAGFKLDTKFFV